VTDHLHRDAAPRWAQLLLRIAAGDEPVTHAIGDLHEVHRMRIASRGRIIAGLLTTVDAFDVAWALWRERRRRGGGTSIATSALDFKLGYRMLRRYPALTVVAVLAMSFGIAGGTTGIEFLTSMSPPLPYAAADRIVKLEYINRRTMQVRPPSSADFQLWRSRLRTVDVMVAMRTRPSTVSRDHGVARSIAEVAVTPGAFQLLRDRPLAGRGLIPADTGDDAPRVAVISHALWRSEFASSADAVGATVKIDGVPTTVVGVMPKGFAFFTPRAGATLPPAQDLWVPMRALSGAGEARNLVVFGGLDDDADLDKLRAEHATLVGQLAVSDSQAYGDLASQVLTFPRTFANAEGAVAAGMLSLGTVFMIAIMVVVCGNVALLLFARAATRERELALRTALGASRGRVIGQLFAESLVLAAISAVIGLVVASMTLEWTRSVLAGMLESQGVAMPDWIELSLSPGTIAFAIALAAIGATVTGILPGLKVTGGHGRSALNSITAGGTGIRMDGLWTRIIVAQVALTSLLVPVGFIYARQAMAARGAEQGLPAGTFLHGRLGVVEAGANGGATAEQRAAMKNRLRLEPGVVAVSFGSRMPGSMHELRKVHVEHADSASGAPSQVAAVDADFFKTMPARIRAGRGFTDADTLSAAQPVVVNQAFVTEMLAGRSALGQKIRFDDGGKGRERWRTIVGVVDDLPMTIDPNMAARAGVYVPLAGTTPSIEMLVALSGPRALPAARLAQIVGDVAPNVGVTRAIPLSQVAQATVITYEATLRVIIVAGLIAIILTNAGIYAVISFTVARRTREIGVRVALGARPWQIMNAVLTRMAVRVALGVFLGASLGSGLAFGFAEGSFQPGLVTGISLIAGCMVAMVAVCLMACAGPVWRALSIQPTRALSAET
jgi:predicted permease